MKELNLTASHPTYYEATDLQSAVGNMTQKLLRLVGMAGFELATPCTPCKCATRLRHIPIENLL